MYEFVLLSCMVAMRLVEHFPSPFLWAGVYAVITVGSELSECILKQCLVGPAKESMIVVSPSESMTGVCTVFGSSS